MFEDSLVAHPWYLLLFWSYCFILFSTCDHVLGLKFPRVCVVNEPAIANVARKCRSTRPTQTKSLRSSDWLYFEHTRTYTSITCRNGTSITAPAGRYPTCALYVVYTTQQYMYTPVCRDMIRWYNNKHEDQRCCCCGTTHCCLRCIHCYECKTRDHGTLYTMDHRFEVNRQSIGSYSYTRPIVACDRYRLALSEAWCGRQ